MKKLMCTLLLAFVSAYSHAALVFGEATIDDDNKVTIDYVFEGTVADTFLFEVYFDYELFDNLTVTQTPVGSDWDVLAFQSTPSFFEDAILSFESFGDALMIGELLSGFQVSVDYLGTDPLTQLSQSAFVYDPFDFSLPPVVSGPAPVIAVIPVEVNAPASSIVLFFASLGVLFMRARKHSFKALA